MTERQATMIGSGTVPFTRSILPSGQRGNQPGSEGVRTGTQVVLANSEDLVAVDAWAVSGVTIGQTPIELVGPGSNPLPRCREIIIQLISPNAQVQISPTEDSLAEGFTLFNPSVDANERTFIRLPLMHNNCVWGRAPTGAVEIRMIIL